MNLIVAVDINWGIGNNGKLLESIPEDMKFFKEKTSGEGKVIILGRKTLDTFPNGKPLKNRLNIIITRNTNYDVEDAIVVHNIDEVFDILDNNGIDIDNDTIYVVGGASIYKQFLPWCNKAYVTLIHKKYDADAYITNLDDDSHWILTEQSEIKEYNGISYCFNTYERTHLGYENNSKRTDDKK